MLNKLKIYFEKIGNWHIGVVVNGVFQYYTTDTLIEINLFSDCDNSIQVIFLGRDHCNSDQINWHCKINRILINELDFPKILQYNTFSSDNNEYKELTGCDYINLNGILTINVNPNTVKELIKDFLNV
jgi:hypothetical protein